MNIITIYSNLKNKQLNATTNCFNSIFLKLYNAIKTLLKQYCIAFDAVKVQPSLQIARIQLTTTSRHEIVILQVTGKRTAFKIKLQDLLQKQHLLENLHPLDSVLLLLLAKEAHLTPLSTSTWELKQFNGINSQFFSERTGKEMVVITLPNSDHQLCLTIRELINNQLLLQGLRETNKYFHKENPKEASVNNMSTTTNSTLKTSSK